MLIDNFIDYLEELFPAITFFNGTINKNLVQCVGVYLRNGVGSNIALGGLESTSYNTKPLSILIHWTENANLCEDVATSIYNSLLGQSNFNIGDIRIASIIMLDSGPISISRDENNICEMIIRCNIIHDRG